MLLKISLDRLSARAALAIGAIGLCAVMALVIFYQFVIGNTLRWSACRCLAIFLEIPLERFPNSSRLNGRFARNEVVERTAIWRARSSRAASDQPFAL